MNKDIFQPDYIKHACTPWVGCCCSMSADEPSEDCPIHGGAPANRCACGRFVAVRRAPLPAPPEDTDGGGA